MIKLSEIETKYSDYLVDEDKLKELLVKPKPKSVWDLEDGDVYYSVNSTGSINNYDWRNDQVDREIRKHGHMYLTEEEAKFEAERQECEAIMLRYGRRAFKHQEPNWFLYFSYIENQVDLGCNFKVSYPGLIYFDSEELTRKAVESLTESRLKKYILGAESKIEE